MTAREPNAYARAGVDVDIEAEASAIMFEASKRTWINRKGRFGEIIVPFDDFSGIRFVRVGGLPKDSCFNMHGDGTGTKPTAVELTGIRATIGIDLVAMLVDDAAQKGGEGVVLFNGLDLKTLGTDRRHLPTVQSIADGLVVGADRGGVAVINGELAQMGMRISGYDDFPFNWMGSCAWFFRESKILTGRAIRVGDVIILFREKGFRCNGFSLVYKILRAAYGEDWHRVAFGVSTLGEEVLTPSTIYARAIVEAHGGFENEGTSEIHGIAHITGGGIPEKVGRLLRPSGLGAHFTDLYDLPAVVARCQELSMSQEEYMTSDKDLYKAWNGGQGMAVVAPASQADGIIACAQHFGIEAKVGGEIVAKPGIEIISKGVEKPGQLLTY